MGLRKRVYKKYTSKGNYSCLICGDKMSDKNYAISRHIKKHNVNLHEYIGKYYKLTQGEYEKCSFCDKIAIPIYYIDHKNKEYQISYDGFLCKTQECKNKISLDILGIEYNSKKYEKIGSKKEYLSKLYRISMEDAMKLKFSPPKEVFRCRLDQFISKYGEIEGKVRYKKRIDGITKNTTRNKFPCTLENFINRYGIKIGTEKYNSRCERISYTSSLDFFVEKYGEEKGNEVWRNKFKQTKISKKSIILGEILKQIDIKYEIEKSISSKFVDYFLPDYNIVIEYFGDYWHCNPKKYDKNFYTRQLKMTAGEIWENDRNRLNEIKQNVDSVIVIWESSNIESVLLEKIINDVKNKKIIIYI